MIKLDELYLSKRILGEILKDLNIISESEFRVALKTSLNKLKLKKF